MMKLFLISFFLFVILLGTRVWAQDDGSVTLSGYVLEKGTKEPVLGGSLYLKGTDGTDYSADTDLKGHYQVTVPTGVYQLVVAGEGFVKKTLATFSMTVNVDKTFYLERDGFTLPEVVVSTDKAPPTQVSHESLSKEELMSVAGTGEDVLKAIQSLPGIVTAGSLNGQLLVRGSGPFQNLYYVDNVPIGFPYHFGIVSTVDSNLIKDIDFYAGGEGPEFTEAQGGVVDMTQRDPRSDRWGFRVDVNLFLSEAELEGPLTSNSSIAFSARRSYLDAFIRDFTGSGIDVEVPVFQDYQLKYSYKPAPKIEWTFVALGSTDTVGGTLSASATVAQQDPAAAGVFNVAEGFNNQGLNYSDDRDDRNQFLNTAYHTNTYFNFNFGQGFYANNTVEIFGDKFTWTHSFDDETKLVAGVQYDHLINYTNAHTVVFPGDSDPSFTLTLATQKTANDTVPSEDAAAFADQKFSFFEKKLDLAVGARVDYLSYDSLPILAPRVSAAYHLLSDTTLKASYGYYYDEPNRVFGAGYIDPTLGNPSLGPEQSITTIVGVEQRLTKEGALFRVEAYEKDLSSVFVYDPVTNYSNAGTGYSRGVEFFLRQPPTERFFGWIAYSLSTSQRQDAPGQPYYPYDYDSPNVLTVVANYKVNPGWDAGFKWSYLTGLPYSPVTGAVYNSANNFYVGTYGPVNSARYPDYSRVDLETSFKTVYDTWEWRVYFDIINVFNAKNVLAYQYSADYSSYTTQYDLPFLPFIGFEAKY